jgi:sortase A
MRDEVFSDMKIAMMDIVTPTDKEEEVAPEKQKAENLEEIFTEIDYSKYLGVLEIPKIRLKRGFYSTDNRYNKIDYNVTLVSGSNMPGEQNGNTILIAHSGDSYISYFAYLWKLDVGDDAFILYNGQNYHYQIVNIYNVEKNGIVNIDRNYDRTTLTLVTCTKDNDYLQTVYIAELVG